MLLAAKIHGFKPTRQIWIAVALTIVGIVAFTVISASFAAPVVALPPTMIITFCVAVYLIGATLGLIGGFGPARLRCLAWATGGSFFYGLSSALVKTTSELLAAGDYLHSPLFWVVVSFLLCSYATGGWMVQQGYANGPAEIVVGSMTTTDPIVGVTFGMVVLGEGALLTVGAVAGHADLGCGGDLRGGAALPVPSRVAQVSGCGSGRVRTVVGDRGGPSRSSPRSARRTAGRGFP